MSEVITGEKMKIVHECDCDLEAEMYPNEFFCDHGFRWPALAAALHTLVSPMPKRDLAYLGTALEMQPEEIRATVAKAIMRSEPHGLALEGDYVVSTYCPRRDIWDCGYYCAVMLMMDNVGREKLTVGEAAARLGRTPEDLAGEVEGPYLMVVGKGPLAERHFEPEGY